MCLVVSVDFIRTHEAFGLMRTSTRIPRENFGQRWKFVSSIEKCDA